jgi:hypothetical protein
VELLALGTTTSAGGGDLLRFHTRPHPCDGGSDRQARPLDVCLLTPDGELGAPHPMKPSPDPWRKPPAPSRDALVRAAAGVCPWSWRAALCAQAGRPCVRGPVLSLQALHGGTAKHDQREAPTSAGVRRGGRRPQASA